MTDRILWVQGAEPNRVDETPMTFEVGRAPFIGAPVVTEIRFRDENRGDHSICWFDAYAGETLVASLNERHVAVVYRGAEVKAA
ncbi:MAG: hypothetical protein JO255_02505 [Alphaproteobacteria bacterium]|nr:hypothetical protein [Alphaproteobacteria bacterium]